MNLAGLALNVFDIMTILDVNSCLADGTKAVFSHNNDPTGHQRAHIGTIVCLKGKTTSSLGDYLISL